MDSVGCVVVRNAVVASEETAPQAFVLRVAVRGVKAAEGDAEEDSCAILCGAKCERCLTIPFMNSSGSGSAQIDVEISEDPGDGQSLVSAAMQAFDLAAVAGAGPGGISVEIEFATSASAHNQLLLSMDFVDLGFAVNPLIPNLVELLPEGGERPPALVSNGAIREAYGRLELDSLYRVFKVCFSRLATRFALREQKQVSDLLKEQPHRQRWETLRVIDLNGLIVGDRGMLPLLGVMSCCSGLQVLRARQNSITNVSAKGLFTTFRSHRAIEYLDLGQNEFYEAAGETILRLLRVNRRILSCLIDGNAFSNYLQDRFQRQLLVNSTEFHADVFNPCASQYEFAVEFESLPKATWDAVTSVWSTLVVIPHDAVAEARPDPRRASEAATGVSAIDSVTPLFVGAPLLSLVMRSVERKMRGVTDDPAMLRIFSDIEAPTPDGANLDAYGQSFVKMIAVPLRIMISAPHRTRDAARVLRGVGRQHAAAGVQNRHYRAAVRAFVDALTTHVGPEVMTANFRAAWVQVLSVIIRYALSGKMSDAQNFV